MYSLCRAHKCTTIFTRLASSIAAIRTFIAPDSMSMRHMVCLANNKQWRKRGVWRRFGPRLASLLVDWSHDRIIILALFVLLCMIPPFLDDCLSLCFNVFLIRRILSCSLVAASTDLMYFGGKVDPLSKYPLCFSSGCIFIDCLLRFSLV